MSIDITKLDHIAAILLSFLQWACVRNLWLESTRLLLCFLLLVH